MRAFRADNIIYVSDGTSGVASELTKKANWLAIPTDRSGQGHAQGAAIISLARVRAGGSTIVKVLRELLAQRVPR